MIYDSSKKKSTADANFNAQLAAFYQMQQQQHSDGGSDSGRSGFSSGGGAGGLGGTRSSMGQNGLPVIVTSNLSVVANETLPGQRIARANDPDGDPIVRYRIVHKWDHAGNSNHGWFWLDGVRMAVNTAFFVAAADIGKLLFESARIGQKPTAVDKAVLRAYDGHGWGHHKVIDIRTMHNKYRPVIFPVHQSLIAGAVINGRNLFNWTDRDNSTIKYYEFYDNTPHQNSAFFQFKGQVMAPQQWFRVLASELGELKVFSSLFTWTDRFRIRASDGRHLSKIKTSIVNSLERPLIDSKTTIVVNELERIPLSQLFWDNGSVPPIRRFQFIDMNANSISGRIMNGFVPFQADKTHTVYAQDMPRYTFQGGRYDNRSRDMILARGFNGSFWSGWKLIEVITEPHHIAALDANTNWSMYLAKNQGQPLVITYSFLQRVPPYYPGGATEYDGFSRVSTVMAQEIRRILQGIEDVTDVRFVEVSDVVGGVLRFGMTVMDQNTPGRTYIPEDPNVNMQGGDVWFNNLIDLNIPRNWPGVYNNTEAGTLGPALMRYYIGLAMGLKTPSTGFPLLPALLDNHQFTSMAFIGGPVQRPASDRYHLQTNGFFFRYTESQQLYDVAAYRDFYGRVKKFQTGDDVYTFAATRHTVATLVDDGGTDTLDMSNQVIGTTIDLRQGAFSSFGREFDVFFNVFVPGNENLAISYGTEIENATGSNLADRITGNELRNTLVGRAGSDRLNGLGENDLLKGGANNDFYEYDIFGGHDTIDEEGFASVDRLEVHSHTAQFNDFTEDLSFRRDGNDLVMNIVMNKNNGRDLVDGSVRIVDMTGTNGVETLRLLDRNDNNILGTDVDLTSIFNAATSSARHFQLTGAAGTYGEIAAPV